jgi:hypothetical protein
VWGQLHRGFESPPLRHFPDQGTLGFRTQGLWEIRDAGKYPPSPRSKTPCLEMRPEIPQGLQDFTVDRARRGGSGALYPKSA